MSEFIILGYPVSPFLRSVAMVLEEKGVPYQVRDFGPGGIGCEAHRQVHPFARIPAIDDGGYRLYETQAILCYIDAKFPDPPLQPVRPEAIGRMNQIIGINDCYLFPQVARTIVGERIMRPAFMGTTPDEAAIAGAVPAAEHCLNELDRLLDDQPFLAGSQLSLADLLLAPQIDTARRDARGQRHPERDGVASLARPDERPRQHEGDHAAGGAAASGHAAIAIDRARITPASIFRVKFSGCRRPSVAAPVAGVCGT